MKPTKTAYWISDALHHECSLCHRKIELAEAFEDPVTKYPYCHCGAKMVKRKYKK